MRITESGLRRIIRETLEDPFIQFLMRMDPGLVQLAKDETLGLSDDVLTAELEAAEAADHDWRQSSRDERKALGLARNTERLDTLRTAAALRGLKVQP